MTVLRSVLTISIVVVGTMLTRFLPFLIFPEHKAPPQYILYLGKVLPYAVIGLLVVYSLKNAFFSRFYALPELIAVAFVAILHVWRKNTLLSIAAGTALYMILVQNIFV